MMDEFKKFYNKALKFLSYRPRSEKEVRDHLKCKAQNAKRKTTVQNSKLATAETGMLIEKVIQKLKEQNFINDEEFVKWWIESRLRFKPRSIKFIKMELKQKGINDEIIQFQISIRQLADKFQIGSDLELAKKIVEKKLPQLAGFPKEKQYQKLQNLLLRRGFTYDTIRESIGPLLNM